MYRDTEKWFASLQLHGLAPLFEEQEIDLKAAAELTEEDLRELGLQMGPRKKLLRAIADLQQAREVETTSIRREKVQLSGESQNRHHLAHRVLRHPGLAAYLLDQLPMNEMRPPDPHNRFHNQHPQLSPSTLRRNIWTEVSGGSLLDAYYPNTGIKLACPFTNYAMCETKFANSDGKYKEPA